MTFAEISDRIHAQQSTTINQMKTNLNEEDVSIVYEAAWFAFRHKYEEVAEYLDLSDDALKPLIDKLDSVLNDEEDNL